MFVSPTEKGHGLTMGLTRGLDRLKTQHCHVQQSLSGDFQNVSEQLTVTLLPCGSLYILVGGRKEDRDREGEGRGQENGAWAWTSSHREVLKALRVLFRDSNPDTQLTSKNKGYQACSEYTPGGFSLKKRVKS